MKLSSETRYLLTYLLEQCIQRKANKKVIDIINLLLDESQSEEAVMKAIVDLMYLEQESKEARLLLGVCNIKGIGVPTLETVGLEKLQPFANEGDAVALCALGDYSFQKKNLKEAVEFYINILDTVFLAHFPKAFNVLGLGYYNGLGVDQDIQKAIEYFVQGSEGQDLDAMENLARTYVNSVLFGEDRFDFMRAYLLLQEKIKRSESLKIKVEDETQNFFNHVASNLIMNGTFSDPITHFTKLATKSGYEAYAAATLGFCYHFGLGTKIDLSKAIENYQLANALGIKSEEDIKLCQKRMEVMKKENVSLKNAQSKSGTNASNSNNGNNGNNTETKKNKEAELTKEKKLDQDQQNAKAINKNATSQQSSNPKVETKIKAEVQHTGLKFASKEQEEAYLQKQIKEMEEFSQKHKKDLEVEEDLLGMLPFDDLVKQGDNEDMDKIRAKQEKLYTQYTQYTKLKNEPSKTKDDQQNLYSQFEAFVASAVKVESSSKSEAEDSATASQRRMIEYYKNQKSKSAAKK